MRGFAAGLRTAGAVLCVWMGAACTGNDQGAAGPDVVDDNADVETADSEPEDTGPEDTATPDTGPEDTGTPDTGPEDAGPEDTGPPDTGPEDAGPEDAGPADIGPPDTGPEDTGPEDTGPEDAGPEDIGPPDTGSEDTGPGCADVACDDNNPCTDDACDPTTGKCKHPPNTAPCDDGNACSVGQDRCKDGKCAASPKGCNDDFDPTKDSACLVRACDAKANKCVYVNEGKMCAGGSGCAVGWCWIGICKPDGQASAKKCDDGKNCTTDACDPATGKCTHKVAATAGCCSANKDCGGLTKGCVKGVCDVATNACKVEPSAALCDDKTACTLDTCNQATGKCAHTPIKGCCTADKDCDDGNSCSADSCDPAAHKCMHTAASNATCSDGNGCTTQYDHCKGTVCVPGPKDCNYNYDPGVDSPCMRRECDKKLLKCFFPLAGKQCDATGCYRKTCQSGHCKHDADLSDKSCDDAKPCTVDTCDKATLTCSNKADLKKTGCCDSAKDCAAPGKPCLLGTCDPKTAACAQPPKPMNCDDGNPCTVDSCTAVGGVGTCGHKPAPATTVCDGTSTCDGQGKCKPLGCVAWASVRPAEDEGRMKADDHVVAIVPAAGGAMVVSRTGPATGSGHTATASALNVMRVNAAGKTLWSRFVHPGNSCSHVPHFAVGRADGGVWVTGTGTCTKATNWAQHLDKDGKEVATVSVGVLYRGAVADGDGLYGGGYSGFMKKTATIERRNAAGKKVCGWSMAPHSMVLSLGRGGPGKPVYALGIAQYGAVGWRFGATCAPAATISLNGSFQHGRRIAVGADGMVAVLGYEALHLVAADLSKATKINLAGALTIPVAIAPTPTGFAVVGWLKSPTDGSRAGGLLLLDANGKASGKALVFEGTGNAELTDVAPASAPGGLWVGGHVTGSKKDRWLMRLTAKGEAQCAACPDCCKADTDCDDNKPCTEDSCDKAAGKCAHKAKSCDDANVCTLDSCEVKGGKAACVHMPASATVTCGGSHKCDGKGKCLEPGGCGAWSIVRSGVLDGAGAGTDHVVAIVPATDGAFFVGRTPGPAATGGGGTSLNVTRISAAGKVLWSRLEQPYKDCKQVPRGAVGRADGGLWVVGRSSCKQAGGGALQSWYGRLDKQAKNLGAVWPGASLDARALHGDGDGVFVGGQYSVGSATYARLRRVDAQGKVLSTWTATEKGTRITAMAGQGPGKAIFAVSKRAVGMTVMKFDATGKYQGRGDLAYASSNISSIVLKDADWMAAGYGREVWIVHTSMAKASKRTIGKFGDEASTFVRFGAAYAAVGTTRSPSGDGTAAGWLQPLTSGGWATGTARAYDHIGNAALWAAVSVPGGDGLYVGGYVRDKDDDRWFMRLDAKGLAKCP